MTKPVFETERLRVFMMAVEPTGHNAHRTVFIAFRTDEDRPMVAATMVLWYCPTLCGWYVDWLEVSSEHRRQKIATEFRSGIENYLGEPLISDAGSKLGELFLSALDE